MAFCPLVWGPRQGNLCKFRGLLEKSDISSWNWKYQNTLSEPYENKSKELLLEIVMVALEGWNLGNLSRWIEVINSGQKYHALMTVV